MSEGDRVEIVGDSLLLGRRGLVVRVLDPHEVPVIAPRESPVILVRLDTGEPGLLSFFPSSLRALDPVERLAELAT